MATKVETTKEVVITTSVKVIEAIIAQVSAAVTLQSKKRITAQTVLAEANRLGYDKAQASKMVAKCWLTAFKMDNASDADKAAFSLKSRPDVSKVITLAYPESNAELAKAYKHNDALPENAPKQNRIGENNLLEIARGNVKVADILNAKAATKAAKPSKLDTVVSKQERLQNAFAGILSNFKIGTKGQPTLDECNSAYEAARDKYAKSVK